MRAYILKYRLLTVGLSSEELVPTLLSKSDPAKNGSAIARSAAFNGQPKQHFHKTKFIKLGRGIGVDED